MNPAEKRRKQLLEQTRRRYSDRRDPPAVHPRYGSAYSSLYEEEWEGSHAGTLGIRIFLCLLLFAAFVTLDKQEQEIFHMDSSQIVEEITTDTDVAEVWQNL